MNANLVTGARRRSLATLGAVALVAALVPAAALAVAPSNDDIASPRLVTAVPYTDGPYDTTEATTGATDGFCFEPEAGPDRATVWYSFTPEADDRFVADTFGSDYDTTLYVGTPDGAGGIDVIACNDDVQGLQSAVFWAATAGTTYLLAVGTCCGGGSAGGSGGGGMLEFHLDVAPPPPLVDLRVDPRGTFSPYGAATITGTVTCDRADGAFVDLGVEQRVGRFILRGFGFTEVACDGTAQPWSVEVTSDSGRFLGGAVDVTAFAQACGPAECADDVEQVRVRLRR